MKGTVAVITGSSGQLGAAIARALGAAGCNCVCHYNHNVRGAEEVVGQIEGMGVRAMAVQADLTEPEQIGDLFEKASAFGAPRILINSAAVFSEKRLAELTFKETRRVLDLNLTAPILMSQEFARVINAEFAGSEAVAGKIINVADVGGIRPWAGYVAYCSSKSGLIGATRALAKELAPLVCVNAIAPGIVNWPGDFDETQKKRQISFIPMGRIAEAKEVTDAIIFLLKNDYITGQVLNVDGGRSI